MYTTLTNPDIIGYVAIGLSLLTSCYGIPMQIWKIHSRLSCADVSVVTIWVIWFNYCCWEYYGCIRPDWVLITAEIPGVVFSSVLLVQMYLLRNNVYPFGTPAVRMRT